MPMIARCSPSPKRFLADLTQSKAPCSPNTSPHFSQSTSVSTVDLRFNYMTKPLKLTPDV